MKNKSKIIFFLMLLISFIGHITIIKSFSYIAKKSPRKKKRIVKMTIITKEPEKPEKIIEIKKKPKLLKKPKKKSLNHVI